MESVAQIIGWIGLIVTAFAGAVAGIRALIRGPKEDKALEAEVQDRVTAMAERWLDKADKRLTDAEAKACAAERRAEAAEARAEQAELKVSKLTPRVEELEQNLFSALRTIEILWPWGLSGGGEPRPTLPAWIYEWLHKQGKCA